MRLSKEDEKELILPFVPAPVGSMGGNGLSTRMTHPLPEQLLMKIGAEIALRPAGST
jgi:hypothetical protein